MPFFTKDLKDIKGLSTINARSGTITKAPTWREPFKTALPDTRQLFLEWPKEGKPPKQPYAIELGNGRLFAFAGLWDTWRDKDGHWLQSYAIVTTEANEFMAKIRHPRMPVILHARDYDRWLDREETERLPLDLLRPFEAEAMEMYKANPKVNNVRNNGPDMLRVAERCCGRGSAALKRLTSDMPTLR